MLSRIAPLSWICLSLVVCVILASRAIGAPPVNQQLQALIRDTSSQFELSYRLRPAEARTRQAELQAVIAAWRAAPQSDANNERLSAWLRGAIRSSMPGSRQALPTMPKFAGNERVEVTVLEKIREKPSAPAAEHPVETLLTELRSDEATPAQDSPAVKTSDELTDPFVDDPQVEE